MWCYIRLSHTDDELVYVGRLMAAFSFSFVFVLLFRFLVCVFDLICAQRYRVWRIIVLIKKF